MIAALVPAYNSETTVGQVAAGARPHVAHVLVVDDGSSDATGARAAAAGAEVIRHPVNRGKGAALRTGFASLLERGARSIVTLDADLQHDPGEIPRFISAGGDGGADLVIGSRASCFGTMTRGRRVGNRFSCGALRFFTGLELPDSQSGYRLYTAGFLGGLTMRRSSYDAEMEILLVAARQRRRIRTIPISMRDADGSATSYFRPWVDTLRICRTVVQFSVCTF